MRHRLSLLAVFCAIVMGLSSLSDGSARAQDSRGNFTAHAVPIDATAASALAAKQAALVAGQADGLQQVLRRLTLRADHARLPKPSPNDVAGMVVSFRVADEKTSEVRYLAKLTVEFRPEAVQALLRTADIPFSETQARPVLVLPVFEREGVRMLFEEENLWRLAWGSLQVSEHGLLPLVQPLGDLQDLTTIDADTALLADADRFRGMMERYGAASVAVAQAVLQGDPAETSALKLDVTTYRTGAIGNAVHVGSFTPREGEDLSAFLQRAARQTASDLQEDWKQRTILHFREQASLSARIEFSSLEDWVEIRRRLAGVASISQVELLSISVTDAQVILHYLGATEPLETALRATDLQLEMQEGFWELRRRDVAGTTATEGASPARVPE